jgi:chorismate-pyruvate lyase
MTDTLITRHFSLQDKRPAHLREIDLLVIDPALRDLLFTDGTVTRMLEAQVLSAVSVTVLAQDRCAAVGLIGEQLEGPSDGEPVRRRVTISIGDCGLPVIWAESYFLPERLPAGFLAVLNGSAEGIGGSLQQVRLEGWREMLWFGLDSPPFWDDIAPAAAPAFLTRVYRVITHGLPALVISESFALEETSGAYRLACSP